ncbi:hypothetical protein [Streptomyces sp. NRRL S-646]|uniref:hypothetical protein n=1 Tax=Streptomyces sp. NRRL S-646 TaxID=1463917 RepID=UPI0004CA449F|nr:hypothetical protein [Streptomyces sp. NRRL S-646]
MTASHHEADIYADGTKFDTLVADGLAAYGELNGLHVVLRPDGRLSSWVDRALAPQPDDTDRPAPTAPATPATPDATTPAPSNTPSAAADAG